MKPVATIIVPTFNHGPLLTLAVESARRQTEQRLEIIVIGDGASPPTVAAAEALVAADSRIRFLPFPKDSSKGERYRHGVLQEVDSPIVCYLADDDLWTPFHVETMLDLLTGADVATTLMARVPTNGSELEIGPAGFVDLGRPTHRRLFAQPTSGFASGISAVAHTSTFYRGLRHGWRTSPPGIPTDGWMWKQLLEQPGVRAVSACKATVLNFHSPPRRFWSLDRRFAEMTRAFASLTAGQWDQQLERLAAKARQRSFVRAAWQILWMQMHHTPLTGIPAMKLAYSLVNRPAP